MRKDMKFTEFKNKVDEVLQTPLPGGEAIVTEGRIIGADNQACFRYQNSYWSRLIDASICCTALSRRSS
jgi:hypothetical protein